MKLGTFARIHLFLTSVTLVQAEEAETAEEYPIILTQVGKRVTLPCNTTVNKPVDWRRQAPIDSHVYSVVLSGIVQERFEKRFSLDRSKHGEYGLVITDVQRNDAGLYRCTEESGIGAEHVYLLNVTEPDVEFIPQQTTVSDGEQGAGAVVGAVVGLLIVALAVAAVVLFLLYIRRRRGASPVTPEQATQEERENLVPEVTNEQDTLEERENLVSEVLQFIELQLSKLTSDLEDSKTTFCKLARWWKNVSENRQSLAATGFDSGKQMQTVEEGFELEAAKKHPEASEKRRDHPDSQQAKQALVPTVLNDDQQIDEHLDLSDQSTALKCSTAEREQLLPEVERSTIEQELAKRRSLVEEHDEEINELERSLDLQSAENRQVHSVKESNDDQQNGEDLDLSDQASALECSSAEHEKLLSEAKDAIKQELAKLRSKSEKYKKRINDLECLLEKVTALIATGSHAGKQVKYRANNGEETPKTRRKKRRPFSEPARQAPVLRELKDDQPIGEHVVLNDESPKSRCSAAERAQLDEQQCPASPTGKYVADLIQYYNEEIEKRRPKNEEMEKRSSKKSAAQEPRKSGEERVTTKVTKPPVPRKPVPRVGDEGKSTTAKRASMITSVKKRLTLGKKSAARDFEEPEVEQLTTKPPVPPEEKSISHEVQQEEKSTTELVSVKTSSAAEASESGLGEHVSSDDDPESKLDADINQHAGRQQGSPPTRPSPTSGSPTLKRDDE